MDQNYFVDTDNDVLLRTYMIELVEGIMAERGLESTDQDNKNEIGQEITREWEEGKTSIEKSDILFEKFGTEKEKEDYLSWKSKLEN